MMEIEIRSRNSNPNVIATFTPRPEKKEISNDIRRGRAEVRTVSRVAGKGSESFYPPYMLCHRNQREHLLSLGKKCYHIRQLIFSTILLSFHAKVMKDQIFVILKPML